MAFPTTSVLTNFTGGDENPLSEGGNWAGPIMVARNQWQRLSNLAQATSGNTNQSYWTPATYTETEVYAKIATKGGTGNDLALCARIVAPNTAGVDMYQLDVVVAAGTDTWTLYRIINAAATSIATFTATEVAVNDLVGLEVLGTGATVTLNAYHKPSAGAWTLIGTFGDTNAARIVSAGNIGLETSNASVFDVDDFGGGEVVVAGGVTSQLNEDGSGGNENPWATDLNGVAVAIGNAGTSGTTDIQILNSRIEMKTASGVKQHAIGAASDFANGIVRGKVSISHAGGSDNNAAGLELRTTTAASATGIGAALVSSGASDWSFRLLKSQATVASVSTTIVAGALYELVLNAYDTDSVRCVKYNEGSFAPGTDYKTIAWDIDRAGVGDGFPSAAGKVGVYSSRNVAAATTHVVDQINAFASGVSVDVVNMVEVAAGDAKVTVETSQAANLQKRATAWYFLRYKAGSEPSDENDGTLWTDDGDGDLRVRADGRFLHSLDAFDITGLTNGTTYYVRPFALMWDETIVAGTSLSATPVAPGSGAPTPPLDFIAAYAVPHVAQRVDFTWTNPSLAGDYKITYRTDGINPTGPTNGTVLQDWTAYTANSAGSKSATGLTNGLRYRSAIWHRDAGLTVNTGAFVQKVPVKQITLSSPADATTGLQPNPYLVWATSSGEAESAKPIHYKLEVSTSEASEVDFALNGIFAVSSLDDGPAGFEYESSAGVWTALPATGLASADVGKNVRHRFPVNIIGQLFWRVSAQQPES